MRRFMLIAAGVLLGASAPAGAATWWVPAAAHAGGAEGSVWRSDLTLHSFASDTEDVTVVLLRQGADNSVGAPAVTVTVAPGATVTIADVVAVTFGATGTAALRVDAQDDRMVVASRTYNQSSSGTFGQAIPGVREGSSVEAGQAALLLGLSGTDGRRTNLGWVSTEATEVTVKVELLGADGSVLGSRELTEKPYGQTQLNDVFGALGVEARPLAAARVTATGRVQPYASVVAGGSNDPVYVTALTAADAGAELLVPAVAHVAGAQGTSWRSDVWVANLGSGTAHVTAELWLQGQGNPAPATTVLEIAPGGQVEVADVVWSQFGQSSAQGALAIVADQLVLATSRTFNTAASGTFGQLIPARRPADWGGVGEVQYLAGAMSTSDFRTNLGLVTTADGAQVHLVLRAADGQELGATDRTLAAGEQEQLSLPAVFGVSGFTGATVEATLASTFRGGGVLACYLSTVDNASSDPTFSEASRGLGADPGLEQLDEVVVATNRALGQAMSSSGPQGRGASTEPRTAMQAACASVEYRGDTVQPGESLFGKCWQATTRFDQCSWELAGYGLTLDGGSSADVCVGSGYPGTLELDLAAGVSDGARQANHSLDLDGRAGLTFGVDASGTEVTSGTVDGGLVAVLDGVPADVWADLTWAADGTGYALAPRGTLALEAPYGSLAASTVLVTAVFDGTEWALVEARAGYWTTSFAVNLRTGEVRPT